MNIKIFSFKSNQNFLEYLFLEEENVMNRHCVTHSTNERTADNDQAPSFRHLCRFCDLAYHKLTSSICCVHKINQTNRTR